LWYRNFVTLVGQARGYSANATPLPAPRQGDHGANPVTGPRTQILMDQRLENLKRVHENFDNLSGRIAELESNHQNLENQQLVIRNMLRKINQPLPVDP
jgi:TolA-binding protein